MKNLFKYKTLGFLLIGLFFAQSCDKEYLDVGTRGTDLENDFYQTPEEMFQGLVACYDVLGWHGTSGWSMKMGLLTAASDEAFAGGSDAGDQPDWVAWDAFTVNPELGPQVGLWQKSSTGIYRANLYLQKLAENTTVSAEFRARSEAEARFIRAYFYFDWLRFFGNVPLITEVLSQDNIYDQVQASPAEVYAQIEEDLRAAKATAELPSTVSGDELGRITKGAVNALLGKVILYQNDETRMNEAAALFEEVIDDPQYELEANFGDIFKTSNEFGKESVFEIVHSSNRAGTWEFDFGNGTEGNYNTQFFGYRDYVGPDFAFGYGFCPISEKLVEVMENDPRFEHTIIDGNQLMDQGASFTVSYQSTGYRIRKYAGLTEDRALNGDAPINWGNNEREIRLADVLLMAAEAHARAGNSPNARGHLNRVRSRVALQPLSGEGQALLDAIYLERQKELATEGHRFFDLVRTGRAATELGDQGFTANKNELLPIPQFEVDIVASGGGAFKQNPGY